jgi:hypothetical protein
LAYPDDANIVGENIVTVKKNRKALLDGSKEVGLEDNLEKTKYMLISCSQKIGQKRSIKTANKSFEEMTKFKYRERILTDQNWMHEEIKSRINRRMLATVQFRVFCPPACSLRTQRLKYTEP